MTQVINRFDGQHEFLSNFYESLVLFEGLFFPTVEHAYQAAKTLDREKRQIIKKVSSPGEAKRLGQKVILRLDWEQVKIPIMEKLIRNKFSHDGRRELLLSTDNAELIEGNSWGDTFWGVCKGNGSNHLGKILMKIRAEIRSEIYQEENKNNLRRNVLDI